MSTCNPQNPLIVQSDRTLLLEVEKPHYEACREAVAGFAELEKSPEHIHTYRITPLSLWNAAAAGMGADAILDVLDRFSKYDVPANVRVDIADYVSRYGRVKLVRDGERLLVRSQDRALLEEIAHHKRLAPFVAARRRTGELEVDPAQRGHLKHALVQSGYPAEDLAGYVPGAPLEVRLR